MNHLAPLRSISLWIALIAAWLVPRFASADSIEIPGVDFSRNKTPDGNAFAQKGWTVEGVVQWWTDDLGARGLHLGPESTARVDVPISKLSRRKGAPEPDPKKWAAVILLEGSRLGAQSALLKLSTTVDPSRSFGISFADSDAKISAMGVPATQWEPLEGTSSTTWTLELKTGTDTELYVSRLGLYRVPTDPDEMKFAKPNGFNGPDRLDSGGLGFWGYTAHRVGPFPVQGIRDLNPTTPIPAIPSPGKTKSAGNAAGATEKRSTQSGQRTKRRRRARRPRLAPVDRVGPLRVGEIIVGVNGRALVPSSCAPGEAWFMNGHERIFGQAVERARWNPIRGGVKLTVLEVNEKIYIPTERVIPVGGSGLPITFPFDDTVTPRLYGDVLDFIRRTAKKNGTWANKGNRWIQTSLVGLALLGRRDPQDFDRVHRIADWLLERFPDGESFGNLGFWSASYAGIFLTEYGIATGDPRVRPWVEMAMAWVEGGFHESKWGTPALGHGPSGLPYAEKGLIAPASHLLVFEALAARLGVESKVWETLEPYLKQAWSDPAEGGHGAMGYNRAARDKAQFWSRTGLVGLAAHLRSSDEVMRKAFATVMVDRHEWMRNSHAYGYPGDMWGLVGLSQMDPDGFGTVMKEWRWAFGGAWEPGYGLRHTTAHMGSPYMGGEGLINPSLALLLSVRHQGLVITGAKDANWLALPKK